MPRQSYPDTYIPNIYVDVLTTKSIAADDRLHGNTMVCLETAPTVDVDTDRDFERIVSHEFDVKKIVNYLQKLGR